MEAGMLVLTGIGVVVAGASAAFAWVQAGAALKSLEDARAARDDAAVSARESARLAGEANAAFIRQAEAQEEANRIKREEMTPPDWTGPVWVSGHLYRVVNSSKRTIVVIEWNVTPDGTEGSITIETPNGNEFGYGDAFEYVVSKGFGGNAKKLTVSYHFEGEADIQKLIIPL